MTIGTVCEFVQVIDVRNRKHLAVHDPLQAALTYDQVTLREECLQLIEQNTQVVYCNKRFVQ